MDSEKSCGGGTIAACNGCGLLQNRPILNFGQIARCARCGTPLNRQGLKDIDLPLALTLAALVMFVIANTAPFLSLSIEGRQQEIVLTSGVLALYRADQLFLALLVLFTGVLFPFFHLCGLIYVLSCLKTGSRHLHLGAVYRWVRSVSSWSMSEVMLIGILVSVSKLSGTATLVTGVGFYGFMAFVFIMAAAATVLNDDCLWEQIHIAPVTANYRRSRQPI